MSPGRDVSEQRRFEVVQAAIKVFSESGINAKMEDIAAEAGIGKATVYLYFKNKDEVTEAVLRTLFDESMRDFTDSIQTGGDITEKLHLVTRKMTGDFDMVKVYIPVLFEFLALSFRDEGKVVRQVLGEYFRKGVGSVQAVIEEGIRGGEFRDVDAEVAAKVLIAGLEGSMMLWTYSPDDIDVGRQMESVADMFIAGLVA